MALMQKGVALAAGRMPKMINPRVHSALDYAVAGSFLLMGALFWKRNRRAAIGSLLCGGATAAVSLLTDYPGGVRKVIPYAMHGQIDGGLIAMTAAMPRLVNIENRPEAKFFSRQAIAKTAITAMTNFEYAQRNGAGREGVEEDPGFV
jgi:Na+/proline symporter